MNAAVRSRQFRTFIVACLFVQAALAQNAAVTIDVDANANRRPINPYGALKATQLTSINAITRLPDVAVSATAFATTVPAQSVTLYVLGTGTTADPNPINAPRGLRIR
ncbi:MAG: hypothetical protein ABI831_28245 [Betaproteobacteria bacterium]